MSIFTIYATETCPNCKIAKQILDEYNIDYEYKIVHKDITHQELNKIVGRNVKAVPVIVDENNQFEVELTSLREYVKDNYF